MNARRVIYKFELESRGRSEVVMPKGAQILAVQNQRERIQLWALCDPSAEDEPREFDTRLTGVIYAGDLTLPREFVGTVQLAKGDYVAHVFEVRR